MANDTNCLICGLAVQVQPAAGYDTYDCARCGRWEFPYREDWDPVQPDQQVRISGWIRGQNAMGIVPSISLATLRRVRNIVIPTIRERANILLASLVDRYPRFNDPFVMSSLTADLYLQAKTYSANERELYDLFAVLHDYEKYIETRPTGPPNALTIKGLLAAEELRLIKSQFAQGFVAMSFDPALNPAWIDGFDPAIRAAGYSPMRIDNKEYVGGISDEVMAEIRHSRFVVVDYTGHRNNVYFEAGFALGLGLQIIPTCRQDEADTLSFDIRHMNTLTWAQPDDLRVKLSQRIRGVIGAGPSL